MQKNRLEIRSKMMMTMMMMMIYTHQPLLEYIPPKSCQLFSLLRLAKFAFQLVLKQKKNFRPWRTH